MVSIAQARISSAYRHIFAEQSYQAAGHINRHTLAD